jgi:CheY-like chemotaxis protein/HPt (histidine-containing phosphotransfer) domain-containing protein
LTVEREALRSWYLQAMGRHIEELRELRAGLTAAEPASYDAARRVAQALRGSGGTFGFPELSAVAALVESAPDSETLRRMEGLIEYLHRLRHAEPSAPPVHAEWLAGAAGVGDDGAHPDLASAWRALSAKSGLGDRALAERAAVRLGLRAADLSRPGRSALRLVPEALMRGAAVLPVLEDGATVTVATADPTSLTTEIELTRITGRRPVFVVAPPDALAYALAALLDAAETETGPRRRTVAPADGARGKVLVVDDDMASRLLARTVLEQHGHAVVEAGNGREALERLRGESSVALVVADLNMPELDGLELIWEMRDVPEWAHIPVIVLTGETDYLLETKLIEEGADDYICKPLDPRLFAARVRATIRRAGD